jgi:hypothetical protein
MFEYHPRKPIIEITYIISIRRSFQQLEDLAKLWPWLRPVQEVYKKPKREVKDRNFGSFSGSTVTRIFSCECNSRPYPAHVRQSKNFQKIIEPSQQKQNQPKPTKQNQPKSN